MEQPLPASDGILAVLRAATGEAHARLEQAVDIAACLTDPARYCRLLEIFLGFYRPLETALYSLSGWDKSLDLPSRRKTPWLEADLHVFGSNPAKVTALPDCAELPRADSLSAGYACLYVLEGATLGGRQITGMLRQSAVPQEARHFFGSYGGETGTRWRDFIGSLERHASAVDEACRAEIVEAGRQTFACLHDWSVRQCAAS